MTATKKAVTIALQSLETIYKQATRAPRYNDQSAPVSSLTGLCALDNATKTASNACKKGQA